MKSSVRKPWPIVAMLCAAATTGYICRVNVSTAAPLLMEEFGLSQIEMGRIFSAFLLGYALFQIPSGALADHYGARRVLSWIVWFWVIITVLQTFTGRGKFQFTAATALIVFMIFRFLMGISASR